MNPAPEKSNWKWLRAGVAGVALLSITVLLIFGAKGRSSNASAIRELQSRIRQRGEPSTAADLAAMYPPIPDADNGARLLMDAWEQDDPAFWRAFRAGLSPLPKRNELAVKDVPFYNESVRRIGRTNALPKMDVVTAETFLESRKEHMAAVRTALQQTQFRFSVKITNELFMALLPHLGALGTESAHFRLAALLATERGDIDDAITNLEYAARTGTVLTSEPFLISQLSRRTRYSAVLDNMQRLLSQRKLSSEQLDRLDTLMDQMQIMGGARYALMVERVSILDTINLPLNTLARTDEPQSAANEAVLKTAEGVLGSLGLRDGDRRLLLETMEEGITLAGSDDPAALRQFVDLFDRATTNANKFPPNMFVAMLLPGLRSVPLRFAIFEAQRRNAKVAIAIERYRAAHEGRLPTRLEELMPQYLAEIPKDPFDGKPIRFRPLPTGFMVYSIGENEVDEGGKEPPLKGATKDYDQTFTVERAL